MRPKVPKYSLSKVFSLLSIIVLIIALVLVIYLIKSGNENFSVNQLEIKNNFYDITTTNPASILNNLKFPLAGSRICIYSDTDMECITAGELANALKLPNYRKEHICIDEECLGYKDLEILNGDVGNKFKISHHSSDRGPNASHTNCLAEKNVNFVSCDNTSYEDGVNTLGLKSCGDYDINYFTIHDTSFDSSSVAEDVQNLNVQSSNNEVDVVEAAH